MRPLCVVLMCWVALLVQAAVSAPPPPGRHLIRRSLNDTGSWLTTSEVGRLRTQLDARGIRGGFVDATATPHLAGLAARTGAAKLQAYPEDPTHPAAVHSVQRHLTTSGLQSFLKPLTEFHNRYYEAHSGVEASRWIRAHADTLIQAAGRGENVHASLWENPDFPQPNVVVRMEGLDPNAAMIILGAHMDSINSQVPVEERSLARAPGADDDGSGSAAIMEVLHGLLKDGFRPQRSIEFQWYAAEEVGLKGSRNMAKAYAEGGKDVYAMLQIDMAGGGGPFKFIMDYVSEALSVFEMKLAAVYTSTPAIQDTCGYACSDHASWNETGYPSSFPIEGSGTKDPITGQPCPGHTADDREACVDYDYLRQYALLGASFAVELSYV